MVISYYANHSLSQITDNSPNNIQIENMFICAFSH